MKKKILALAAVAAAAVLLPATAAHAYGELSGPNSGSVGSSYSYEVTGLETDDPVTLYVENPDHDAEVTPAGTVDSTGTPVDGAITFDVTFPASGEYTITAEQPEGEGVIGTIVVDVTVAPDDIANTGFDAGPLVWFGGGALILGAVLVAVMAVVRRKNASTPV